MSVFQLLEMMPSTKLKKSRLAFMSGELGQIVARAQLHPDSELVFPKTGWGTDSAFIA